MRLPLQRLRFRFWGSAFYFAFYAAGGSFSPYLPGLYQSAGIPVEQIGLLTGLPMLMMIIANPLWGLAADAFRLHGRLLPLTMLLTLPAAWLLSQAGSFWAFALLALVFSFCQSPILAMGDYAVIQELGDRRYEYGRLRIWGAIGYGLAALYGGYLVERIGVERSFFTYLTMMAFGAFVATRLPRPRLVVGGTLREGLRLLSTDTRWYVFLGSILLAGIGFSTINSFYLLYMKDLGVGESLVGLSISLSGVSELPIFFFSAILLRKWSPRGLLAVAIATLAVRLMLTSLLRDPYLIILVQMTHGLSFSALWAAGVNYVTEIAPPGLGTSSQALFNATLFGLAGMLGSAAGGRIYQALGGAALFRSAALVVLTGFALFLFLLRKTGGKDAI